MPDGATAQRLLATPSLSLSEQYDDNIRSSAVKPESDFTTVVLPRLLLEATDEPWSLTLTLGTRAEFFAMRRELDNVGEQFDANAVLQYRTTPSLTTSLTAAAIRTLDSGVADPVTGVTQGRFPTLSASLTAAATYQATQATTITGRAAYRILNSESPISQDSQTQEAGGSVQHQFDARNSGLVRYGFSRFTFAPPRDDAARGTTTTQGDSQTSHTVRLGFQRAWSPTITLSSENGLIFLERRDGQEEITWGSSQRYSQQFQEIALAISYDRNAAVNSVQGGAGINQTLALTTTWPASRSLTIAVDLRASQTESRGDTRASQFRVYTGTLNATYRLFRWLTLNTSYRHQTQDDLVGVNDVERNVFSIGLTVSDAFRVY